MSLNFDFWVPPYDYHPPLQGPVCKQVGNMAKKLHATLIEGEACNNYDTLMQNLSLTAKHTVYVDWKSIFVLSTLL